MAGHRGWQDCSMPAGTGGRNLRMMRGDNQGLRQQAAPAKRVGEGAGSTQRGEGATVEGGGLSGALGARAQVTQAAVA